MPRSSTYEVVLDASLFTPTQLQTTAGLGCNHFVFAAAGAGARAYAAPAPAANGARAVSASAA